MALRAGLDRAVVAELEFPVVAEAEAPGAAVGREAREDKEEARASRYSPSRQRSLCRAPVFARGTAVAVVRVEEAETEDREDREERVQARAVAAKREAEAKERCPSLLKNRFHNNIGIKINN